MVRRGSDGEEREGVMVRRGRREGLFTETRDCSLDRKLHQGIQLVTPVAVGSKRDVCIWIVCNHAV